MKKEKALVLFITILICLVLFVYAIFWVIGGTWFIPLLMGAFICLIMGVCIVKCCRDRLKEIEEEKDDISKY